MVIRGHQRGVRDGWRRSALHVPPPVTDGLSGDRLPGRQPTTELVSRRLSSLPLLSFPSQTRPRRHDLGNVQLQTFAPQITDDYWKPVFFLLEREGFECLLYQASQVKALPGRPKTDLLNEPRSVTAAQIGRAHV